MHCLSFLICSYFNICLQSCARTLDQTWQGQIYSDVHIPSKEVGGGYQHWGPIFIMVPMKIEDEKNGDNFLRKQLWKYLLTVTSLLVYFLLFCHIIKHVSLVRTKKIVIFIVIFVMTNNVFLVVTIILFFFMFFKANIKNVFYYQNLIHCNTGSDKHACCDNLVFFFFYARILKHLECIYYQM